MARFISSLSQPASTSRWMAFGIWNTSNVMLYPLRPDAYVTGATARVFISRTHTLYRQEVEVFEARHGFVPHSGEMVASRVRRRYRLLKGGHPYLVLVHYSRGQSMGQSSSFYFFILVSLVSKRPTHVLHRPAIPPGLQGQPVRQYPLRQHNEPAVFVLGERQGQRVPPSGPVGGMPPNVGVGMGVGVGGRQDAQAMLAQQNREMEALERRSQRERSVSMNPGQVCRVATTTQRVFSYSLPPFHAALFSRGHRSTRSGLTKKTRRKSSSIYRLGPSH